jgi:malonyl-CoA O-methyltransferase
MTKPLKRWGPGKTRPIPVLSTLQAYTSWASTYPARASTALLRAEERAVRSLLPDLSGRTVLDLACGTGRWGQIALELGAARVIGLDDSTAMLARCSLRERAIASMDAMPLRAASVDVLICGLAAGHLPFIHEPIRKMGPLLRPGGIAVFSDLHPYPMLAGAHHQFSDADGRARAIEHYVHLVSDWIRAGEAAGWRLTGLREPGLRESERADNPGEVPAVLTVRFERPV